jgi:uncharacterized protein (DUF2147 family)
LLPTGLFTVKLLHRTTLLTLALISGPLFANPLTVQGRWLTQDRDGWIRIALIGDSLEGTIAGAPPGSPGEREFDDRNPEPALRGRKLLGLVIMRGLEYEGDGHWSNGTIYDPNSGKTYRCSLTQLDDNTLRIRGYLGISLFGRSETWTRDDPEPDTD